jgi:hypothetical protein
MAVDERAALRERVRAVPVPPSVSPLRWGGGEGAHVPLGGRAGDARGAGDAQAEREARAAARRGVHAHVRELDAQGGVQRAERVPDEHGGREVQRPAWHASAQRRARAGAERTLRPERARERRGQRERRRVLEPDVRRVERGAVARAVAGGRVQRIN